MKRICSTIIASLLLSSQLFSQHDNYVRQPALGLMLSFHDFKGGRNLRDFGSNMKPGVALYFQNDLSNRFAYNISFDGSYLDFPAKDGHSLSNGKDQLLTEGVFSVQFKLLQGTHFLSPRLQLGTGLSQFNGYFGVFVPVGAGLQAHITKDILVLANSQFRIAITNTQTNHFFHSIGIAGIIGSKKIAYRKPYQAVQKPLRKAPTVLDSDGDGILDSADACPLVPGVIRYHGCPAPADSLAKQGSPEVKQEIKIKVDAAAKNIFFETGKYTLLQISYTALDQVVNILKKDTLLQVSIEGHTDNAGTPAHNMVLSTNRAMAVRTYLESKGINRSRLTSFGYGQERPIASNNTVEGRAQNRRVELHLRY